MCNGVGSVTGAEIDQAASQLGIPCGVVLAQITLESSGNAQAVSVTGAQGVAQFEPGTWSSTGCSGSPFNVSDAMTCYVKLMSTLLKQYNNDIASALSAYNSGSPTAAVGSYAQPILSAAGQKSSATGTGTTGTATAQTDTSLASGGFLSDLGSLLGLGQATTFATDLEKLISGLMWIVTPGAWLRIGAFAVAIILLIGAVIVFTHADEKLSNMPIPVPVPV